VRIWSIGELKVGRFGFCSLLENVSYMLLMIYCPSFYVIWLRWILADGCDGRWLLHLNTALDMSRFAMQYIIKGLETRTELLSRSHLGYFRAKEGSKAM
jgi:hypothetical protein